MLGDILKHLLIKCYILVVFLAFSLASCNDNVQSTIPNYPVRLNLELTAQYPNFKNSFGQFLYFTAPVKQGEAVGYGGIIIFSGNDDNGNTIYYAYDMACPFEAKNNIRVYPDSTGFSQVVCEKCGSVFGVDYGSGYPVSGPAKEAKEFLKQYRTSLSGDNLYISPK